MEVAIRTSCVIELMGGSTDLSVFVSDVLAIYDSQRMMSTLIACQSIESNESKMEDCIVSHIFFGSLSSF